jgi:hypothetical protein
MTTATTKLVSYRKEIKKETGWFILLLLLLLLPTPPIIMIINIFTLSEKLVEKEKREKKR